MVLYLLYGLGHEIQNAQKVSWAEQQGYCKNVWGMNRNGKQSYWKEKKQLVGLLKPKILLSVYLKVKCSETVPICF